MIIILLALLAENDQRRTRKRLSKSCHRALLLQLAKSEIIRLLHHLKPSCTYTAVIKSNYWIQETNNVPTEGMELEQKEGEKKDMKRNSDKILSRGPTNSSHLYAVSHLYILFAFYHARWWHGKQFPIGCLSTQGGPGHRTMSHKGEAKQSHTSQQLCPFCYLILKAIRISEIQE